MFESAFERRVKELSSRAGLKVSELSSQRAKLMFNVEGHSQPLFIIPYEGVWEFSCPSILAVDDAKEIPSAILIVVLKENSTAKRGFWCIERIGDKDVLEYMHNIPENLLTSDEFYKICWGVVKQVEKLEEVMRELIRRLS